MIKTAKFITNQTFICGHCKSQLDNIKVIKNPKHFFNPGQLFYCGCGKSKIWANSVRYMESLEKYCDGATENEIKHTEWPENFGFCNDSFCGKCFNHIRAFKDVVVWNGAPTTWEEMTSSISPEEITRVLENGEAGYYTTYGCEKCPDNKFLIHGGYETEYSSKDGQRALAQWYKNNQPLWRQEFGRLNKKACMSWYNEI